MIFLFLTEIRNILKKNSCFLRKTPESVWNCFEKAFDFFGENAVFHGKPLTKEKKYAIIEN